MFTNVFSSAPTQVTRVVAKSSVPDDEHVEFLKSDLDAWYKLFKKFDQNNDNLIDLVEFSLICNSAAKERGDPPRDDLWIRRAFAEADRDGSGKIEFQEFVMVQYRHKAMVIGPEYAGNTLSTSKAEHDSATRAAKLVTSVPVLRETLEMARLSKDPNLAREAQRLLYSLGDAGKPTLAGVVFAEGEDLLNGKLRSSAGKRVGYTGAVEIGAIAAGNLVDTAVVNSQLTQQRDHEQGSALAAPRSMRDVSMWDGLFAVLPGWQDLDTVFAYFQFQSLTNLLALQYVVQYPTFKHPWPLPAIFKEWQLYQGWMSIFNIDLGGVSVWASNNRLPPYFQVFATLPFNSLYLLVTAAIPLAISFINLILFYPLYQVVWLFVTVLSFALTFSTILAKSLIDENRLAVVGGGTLSPQFLSMLLYIGVGVLAAMLIAAALFRAYLLYLELKSVRSKIDVVKRNVGRADTMQLRKFLQDMKADDGPPPMLPPLVLVRNALFTVTCAVFALADLWGPFLNVGRVLEIVLGVLAIVSFVYNVLSYFIEGRIFFRKAGRIIDQTAVTLFLLLLSIIYMPVTRMLLAVWLSETKVCAPGERFPEFANQLSTASSQWLARGSVSCEPCNFVSFSDYGISWPVNFGSSGQCSAHFCPGSTSVRSFQDPRLGYKDVILPFFGPASLVTLLGFTLGVPYLYFMIISKHTAMLSSISVRSSRVVLETSRKHQGDVEWDYRVSGSNNRAKSLYSIFEYQFRYMKLVLVLQKLLIIAMVIFLYNYLVISAIIIAILHFLYLCYQLYYRPYFDPKSDWLSISCTFACALNPLLIVFTDYGILQQWPFVAVQTVILVVNFGLPFVALMLGWLCSARHKKRLNAKADALERDFTEAEVLKIERERHELDRELDNLTLKYVLRVFVVMAAGGFIAIALLLLGQFWQAATTKVVATTAPTLGVQFSNLYAPCQIEELMLKNELCDFEDWQTFTRHCCCADRQNKYSFGDDFVSGITELWTCDNGYDKERDRSGSLEIRDFCSPVFNPGYSFPRYDKPTLQVVVDGPAGAKIITGW